MCRSFEIFFFFCLCIYRVFDQILGSVLACVLKPVVWLGGCDCQRNSHSFSDSLHLQLSLFEMMQRGHSFITESYRAQLCISLPFKMSLFLRSDYIASSSEVCIHLGSDPTPLKACGIILVAFNGF